MFVCKDSFTHSFNVSANDDVNNVFHALVESQKFTMASRVWKLEWWDVTDRWTHEQRHLATSHSKQVNPQGWSVGSSAPSILGWESGEWRQVVSYITSTFRLSIYRIVYTPDEVDILTMLYYRRQYLPLLPGPMNGSCLCLLISVVYCVLVKACVLLLNSLNSMILLYP